MKSDAEKMWVSKDFKKWLKTQAALNDTTLIKFTKKIMTDEEFEELKNSIKNKNFKKNEKKFAF